MVKLGHMWATCNYASVQDHPFAFMLFLILKDLAPKTHSLRIFQQRMSTEISLLRRGLPSGNHT